MSEAQNQFEFTGAIRKEGKFFAGLCLDLDVASRGRTLREGKKMLAEAVTLYLQACFENGILHLRPVPAAEDARHHLVENPLRIFPRQDNRYRLTCRGDRASLCRPEAASDSSPWLAPWAVFSRRYGVLGSHHAEIRGGQQLSDGDKEAQLCPRFGPLP